MRFYQRMVRTTKLNVGMILIYQICKGNVIFTVIELKIT